MGQYSLGKNVRGDKIRGDNIYYDNQKTIGKKAAKVYIDYNSTYAYLSLSSHSMPPQQLLNVATKSVLTPKQRELNSTQVGQAPAKNG